MQPFSATACYIWYCEYEEGTGWSAIQQEPVLMYQLVYCCVVIVCCKHVPRKGEGRKLFWLCWYTDRVGQEKSKPLEYVNKTEKIGGTWTNMNSYRENEATSDIFMWNILYRNFLFKYSMTESSQWNYCKTDRNKLHKHDIINVCSVEYLTTKIEFVLPTFKSWRFTKL